MLIALSFLDCSYFETQHDIDVLVRGLRSIFAISQTAELSAQIDQRETDPQFDQDLHKMTDAQLENIIRERAETLLAHSLLHSSLLKNV